MNRVVTVLNDSLTSHFVNTVFLTDMDFALTH